MTSSLYYLNNCQNLEHLALYGGNAMFDLWVDDDEDQVANALKPGDKCMVASYKSRTEKNMVVMAEYSFTGKRQFESSSAPRGKVWVLEGQLIAREFLPKQEAAKHPRYRAFFNKAGAFKQQSVIRGT